MDLIGFEAFEFHSLVRNGEYASALTNAIQIIHGDPIFNWGFAQCAGFPSARRRVIAMKVVAHGLTQENIVDAADYLQSLPGK
ncbi:MAG: hypothetical protein ABIO49_07790 [Dokdonella sp.]